MIELLAPAGSPEALDAAVAEGADAVYLGLKSFNARMRSANFAFSQFEGAVKALRRMGRKVYVTVNTVFEQREAGRVWQLLNYLAAVGPDAIIVQDFGVLEMARETGGLRVHASTQMNIASARGANALSARGVSRAVLARELSIDEIRAVRQSTNLELEVFVHGALCVSESGLCLFSSYLGGKSANRGMCTQACRRLYHTEGEVSPLASTARNAPRSGGGLRSPPLRGFHPRNAPASTNSGYFFSPCDLSLIARIPELAEAGVTSFKIEGRMKSAEYVGAVVSAYRLVIDSLGGGEEQQRRALEDARRILRNDFARPKTEYFAGAASGGWLLPDQAGGTGIPLGTILSVKRENGAVLGLVRCAVTPRVGDSARFHRADDSRRQTHKLTAAYSAGGNESWYISIPGGFDTGDAVYLIQTKAMSRRYPPVIPKDLSLFTRRPGRERAPAAPFPALPRSGGAAAAHGRNKDRDTLPEGLYAAAASIEDLYVLQSERPAAAILPVNRKTAPRLLENGAPLPFRPAELILSLDPYFPQDAEAFYAETLPALTEAGYRAFILNNPGHFSLFGGRAAAGKPILAAGPWLYTFNGWAAAFLQKLGADYAVSPLENNRQNLEKTWDGKQLRSRVFVNLFAWPPLFRVRADLGKVYGFRRFSGGRGETFSFIGADAAAGGVHGQTVVIPEQPFSIVDKRPFLEAAGFRRFILDFSGGAFSGAFPLKKRLYKDIMKAAQDGTPLAGTTRFNWKDGFFQDKERETPTQSAQ
jgi:putative protease